MVLSVASNRPPITVTLLTDREDVATSSTSLIPRPSSWRKSFRGSQSDGFWLLMSDRGPSAGARAHYKVCRNSMLNEAPNSRFCSEIRPRLLPQRTRSNREFLRPKQGISGADQGLIPQSRWQTWTWASGGHERLSQCRLDRRMNQAPFKIARSVSSKTAAAQGRPLRSPLRHLRLRGR